MYRHTDIPVSQLRGVLKRGRRRRAGSMRLRLFDAQFRMPLNQAAAWGFAGAVSTPTPLR